VTLKPAVGAAGLLYLSDVLAWTTLPAARYEGPNIAIIMQKMKTGIVFFLPIDNPPNIFDSEAMDAAKRHIFRSSIRQNHVF
jgi:hypothetical protein